MGLQISTRESGDVSILDLRGRSTIDGGESELLSNQLQKLVANGVRKLLLNLADLTQMDSSGVSIIVETYRSLKRQNGDGRIQRGGRLRHPVNSARRLVLRDRVITLHAHGGETRRAIAAHSCQQHADRVAAPARNDALKKDID